MSPAAQVPGAGGVVFDDAGRVLVLTLARGERVFPKGHLEAGETPLEAAVREVEEETGVKAWCDDPTEFTTSYVNPSGVPRRVTWFVMRCSGQTPRVTASGLTAAPLLDDMRALKQSGTLLVSDEAGSLVLLVARGQVEASFRLGAYGRLESPGQSYHLHLHEPAPTPQLPGRSPHSDSAVLRALPRTRTPMRIPTGVVDLPALLERLGALAFDGL